MIFFDLAISYLLTQLFFNAFLYVAKWFEAVFVNGLRSQEKMHCTHPRLFSSIKIYFFVFVPQCLVVTSLSPSIMIRKLTPLVVVQPQIAVLHIQSPDIARVFVVKAFFPFFGKHVFHIQTYGRLLGKYEIFCFVWFAGLSECFGSFKSRRKIQFQFGWYRIFHNLVEKFLWTITCFRRDFPPCVSHDSKKHAHWKAKKYRVLSF